MNEKEILFRVYYENEDGGSTFYTEAVTIEEVKSIYLDRKEKCQNVRLVEEVTFRTIVDPKLYQNKTLLLRGVIVCQF